MSLVAALTCFPLRTAGAAYFLYVTVLFGPILLITVLIHELGHCWATMRIGKEVGLLRAQRNTS